MEIVSKKIKTEYSIKINFEEFQELVEEAQKQLKTSGYVVGLIGSHRVEKFYEWLKQDISFKNLYNLISNTLETEISSKLVQLWCYKNNYHISFYGNFNNYDSTLQITAYRDGVCK